MDVWLSLPENAYHVFSLFQQVSRLTMLFSGRSGQILQEKTMLREKKTGGNGVRRGHGGQDRSDEILRIRVHLKVELHQRRRQSLQVESSEEPEPNRWK